MASRRGTGALAAVTDLREVTSTELHEATTRTIRHLSPRGGALAVTRYGETLAYVLSPDLAEELAGKAANLDALARDVKVVRPYLAAALASGVSPLEAIDELFKDDEGGVRVDFAGLGRLMSRTPVFLELDEDGAPLARAQFTSVAVSGETDEDDYSAFDDV